MRDKRLHATLLAAVVVIGFGLRIIHAGQESLWSDEALTALIVRRSVTSLLLLPTDPTPGFYYLLHKWLIPADAGPAMFRAVSIVAGTLAIIAGYAVGKQAANKGLAVASLIALAPALIDYSQEARAYSLLGLLVLTSAAGLLWWAREAKSSRAAAPLTLFLVSTLLSFYTHFVSVFWIAPAVTVAAVIGVRHATLEARKWLLVGLATLAILAVPEIMRLAVYPAEQMDWLWQVGPLAFLSTTGDTLLPAALWKHNSILSAVGLVVVFGALGVLAGRRARDVRPEAWAVIAILLAAPLATWLFGFFVRPIFMERVMLTAVPGFALLIAVSLRRAELGAVLALFAAALVVGGTVRPKEDWKLADRVLQANARDGDVIVVCGWKVSALRHAVTLKIPASLLLSWGGKLTLMERQLGADRDWEGQYFSILENGHDGIGDGASTFNAAQRIWLVQTDCQMPFSGKTVARGQGVQMQLIDRRRAPIWGNSGSDPAI